MIEMSRASLLSIRYSLMSAGSRTVIVLVGPVGFLGGLPGRAFMESSLVRLDRDYGNL